MVAAKLRISAASLILVVATFSASAAQAECRLVIEPAQEQWRVHYDPFAGDGQGGRFDVAVTNTGDTPCHGQLRAELRGEQFGLSQSGAVDRIHYSLVDQRAGVDVTPRSGRSAQRANMRSRALAPGERSLERISFAFDGEKLVSSGTYSQTLFLSVEDVSTGVRSERSVNLAVEVPRTAIVGVKGQFARVGGAPVIDLGELVEGAKPLQTYVYVKSTSGYSLSITSTNKGRLRLGSSDWYVGYRLALDDNAIDLVNGDRIEVASTRRQSDDYAMRIYVEDVQGRRAGQYSDVLRFVVAAI